MNFSLAVICLLFLTTVSCRPKFDAKSNPFWDSFNVCDFCRNATDLLQQGVDFKNTTVDRIGQALDQVCDNLPDAAAKFCHNFVGRVIGLYVSAYAAADTTLEGFCEGTFQCPYDGPQLFTENGIFETTCTLCKRQIARLVKFLSAEQVTETSARFIAVFCAGPGRVLGPDDCAKNVAKYVEATYGRTVKLLKPEDFCKTTGACLKFGKGKKAEAPAGSVEY